MGTAKQLFICFAILGFWFNAKGQAGQPDALILHRASLVLENEQLAVYRDGVSLDPKLLTQATQAYHDLERLLSKKFDHATLGRPIKIVVSNQVRVSHVWRGYQHMSDPKGVLFLNMRAYQGFMNQTNATVLHELTHLLTWRFYSHSLREGLADYAARQLMPQADVGPTLSSEKNPVATKTQAWQLDHLGSSLEAPPALLNDPEFRKDYYLSSYRFVAALIAKKSLADFFLLYENPQPETAYPLIYGKTRRELVCEFNLSTAC